MLFYDFALFLSLSLSLSLSLCILLYYIHRIVMIQPNLPWLGSFTHSRVSAAAVYHISRARSRKAKRHAEREGGRKGKERNTPTWGFGMLELSRLIDRRSPSTHSAVDVVVGGEMPPDSLKFRRSQMIRPELCSPGVEESGWGGRNNNNNFQNSALKIIFNFPPFFFFFS